LHSSMPICIQAVSIKDFLLWIQEEIAG
jgi:heme/copper-type cytochrome/quinol oxidase subunit 2